MADLDHERDEHDRYICLMRVLGALMDKQDELEAMIRNAGARVPFSPRIHYRRAEGCAMMFPPQVRGTAAKENK